MLDGWWVADLWANNPVMLVSWGVWVLVAICLHELAHGWVAIRLGDRTPIETGHMTANPMVHMGPWSLVAFLVIGIAWGAMPVNPSRLRGRHGDAIVAAAGPAMNLGLAIVSVLAATAVSLIVRATGDSQPLSNAFTFFYVGAALNLLLMLFNLLPVPPLDGSRILTSFNPAYERFFASDKGQIAGLALFVFVFFYGAGRLFGLAFDGAGWAIATLVGLF